VFKVYIEMHCSSVTSGQTTFLAESGLQYSVFLEFRMAYTMCQFWCSSYDDQVLTSPNRMKTANTGNAKW